MQDGNAVPAADLAADGAHPHGRTAGQDPVAALRRPDDMVPVAMDAMRGAIIFVFAEAISDWKSEASNQRVESDPPCQGMTAGSARTSSRLRTSRPQATATRWTVLPRYVSA